MFVNPQRYLREQSSSMTTSIDGESLEASLGTLARGKSWDRSHQSINILCQKESPIGKP